MQETWVGSLGWEDPLQKGMATYSNILAEKITWTKEPGRLQSMGHREPDMTEQLSLHTKDVQKSSTEKPTMKQHKAVLKVKPSLKAFIK